MSTPNPQTSNRPFQELIDQTLMQYTTAFQAGQTVPPTPDDFQKNLVEQASGFGIDFPGTDDTQADVAAIRDAVDQYTNRYADILKMPLPSNPTPEYQAWYDSTHTN